MRRLSVERIPPACTWLSQIWKQLQFSIERVRALGASMDQRVPVAPTD